jgi:general secretion pathway protein K
MRILLRQRGVALLVALVLMALVTIITYDVWFAGALEQRRSFSALNLEQGLQYGLGGEAFAAQVLLRDVQDSNQDFTAEAWATPLPPIPIDGGQIEVGLQDMQGRFNLNNLIDPNTGSANKDAVDQFRRLLELVNLEPKWADLMVDWLDADLEPTFPDGAEDTLYTTQAPPYLAPNGAITSTTELLALPGFGIDRYRRIEPFVAALPNGTAINVCTAPGEVLDSLAVGFRQFSVAAKSLATQRMTKCFPSLNDLWNTLPPTDRDRLQQKSGVVADRSRYFRLTAVTTIGTAQFTLYSLLLRDTGGLSRPILRSWGSE